MDKKVILLTLQTFSTTGGIQKMTRTLAHSLHKIALEDNGFFKLWSLYDKDTHLMPPYLPAANFKGFNRHRAEFIWQNIKNARFFDVVIISHINLAAIGLIVKLINPACKVWVIAHGIEVWRPLTLFKKRILKTCDKIICVSSFTRQQMIALHQTDAAKCVVLNNAIDPFMYQPKSFEKPGRLLARYNLAQGDIILFTLTRLASTEQYKGHEQVIKTLKGLKYRFPNIKYVLAGKYDAVEEIRIKALIEQYDVRKEVILTGFIKETELTEHFLLADLFVLPSKKEGFGIVYIEALACGLPVICGNADGSLDAIKDGELGTAIKPGDLKELEEAIAENLSVALTHEKRQYLQNKCLSYFNEDIYINNLKPLLKDGGN